MPKSPFAAQRKVQQHDFRRTCSRAAAAALREGAVTLPNRFHRRRYGRQAERIALCALTSVARVDAVPGRGVTVQRTNKRACRSKLCMPCAADNSAKHAGKLDAVLTELWRQHPGAVILFLTLTLKSQPIGQIDDMLRRLDAGVKRLHALKRLILSTLGHYSVYELAVGKDSATGEPTAHLHAHAFVAVAPGALSDARYIPQAEWVALWRHAARLTYKPIVDIRRVRSKTGDTSEDAVRAVIPELAKYAVKPGDGLFQHHGDGSVTMDPRVALAIADGLYRRRTVRYGRCFADAIKALRRGQRRPAGNSPSPDPASSAGYTESNQENDDGKA